MKMQSKANGSGIGRLVKAYKCSLQGFSYMYRNEAAFRQEILLCLVGVPAGWIFGGYGVERALLIGSLLLIPLVEILNSAIECVVDRIGPEQHVLSGHAKDLGSAAVLAAMILAATVWGLVLFF